MKSSVTKAIGFWSILFVAICILCAVSAYFFTAHQSHRLRELISDNAEQLASPIPTLAGEPAKLSPSAPVDELLSDIVQRYPINLHYQRSGSADSTWLVTIEADPQQATRFLAEVVRSQYKQYSHFPETESLRWEALGANNSDVYGVLQWQFRWQTEHSISQLEKPIYANHFKPINVPTLSCYDKPFSGTQPHFVVPQMSDARLTAIQTVPNRKAIFKSQNQKWVTALEGDWLGQHTQLDTIHSDSLILSHWQQSGDCWHRYSQQLRIHKESDAS